MKETVLITGVSGYIGLHCGAALLRAGYHVRGTVRSISKEQEVRKSFGDAGISTSDLTFVQVDLTEDKGWKAATKGCAYVLHVASPFAIKNPKSEDEMLKPAVDGTLRVLRAARSEGVKRVVLTSSALTMFGSMKAGTFGPDDWTDPDAPKLNTYIKSKTLAEKAAWDFVADSDDGHKMELVTINPGGVMGPPLGRNITGQTMTFIDQMLRGKMPMVPRMAFPMVDVRDVAKLHLQAMIHPDVDGMRLIASSATPGSFLDAAKIMKDAGYEGPSTRQAPSFLLRIIALFDREAAGMVGMLDMNISADISRTRELFDWTPTAFDKMILDSAEAVRAIQGATS